jgi:hypothetical protein
VPRAGSPSFVIDDDDDYDDGDREEEAADRRENVSSLVKFLYRKIHYKFESLVSRRLEEKLDRWDPVYF